MDYALIDQYKTAGFTPAQALWLINEQRFFNAGLVIHSEVAEKPLFKDALESRQNLSEAFAKIKSPADIRAYKESWANHVMRRPEKSLLTISEKRAFSSEYLIDKKDNRITHLYGEINGEEFVDRLSNTWLFKKTQMEQDLEDSDPDWGDVRAVWEHRFPTWKNDSTAATGPSSKTLSEAMAKLQGAIEKAGIGMVMWPHGAAQDISNIDRLAREIVDSNKQLCERFGVSPNTELLGLGKTTLIGVGFEDDNGGTCISEKGHCILNVQPKDGWSVLAHEWFHGFDGWIGNQIGVGFISEADPSQFNATEKNMALFLGWQKLVQGLQGKEVSSNHELLWTEMTNTWVERWTLAMPHLNAIVEQEKKAMTEGGWTKKEALKRWTEAFVQTKRPNAEIVAWMLVTELNLIRDHGQHANNTPSFVFRREFAETIVQQKEHKWVGDYLNTPRELLAHNFESGFKRNSGFAELKSGEATLRYPLKSEADLQQLHWRRFFKLMKPVVGKSFTPTSLSKGSNSDLSKPDLQWDDMSNRLAAKRKIVPNHSSTPSPQPVTP